MNLKYELTKEDYLAFNLHYIKHSATVRKMLFMQRFPMPVIFLAVPFALWITTGEFPIELFLGFLLLSAAWVVFYPKFFYWYTMRNVNRALNEGDNSNMLGPHEFHASEEGFIEKNQAEERKVNWSGIDRVEENEHYYFLFFSSVGAYIVPKRSFPDKSSEEEFKHVLRSAGLLS